jgi:hypothetical protein
MVPLSLVEGSLEYIDYTGGWKIPEARNTNSIPKIGL